MSLKCAHAAPRRHRVAGLRSRRRHCIRSPPPPPHARRASIQTCSTLARSPSSGRFVRRGRVALHQPRAAHPRVPPRLASRPDAHVGSVPAQGARPRFSLRKRPPCSSVYHPFGAQELPVRLAHRVAELENLPFGLSAKRPVQTVRDVRRVALSRCTSISPCPAYLTSPSLVIFMYAPFPVVRRIVPRAARVPGREGRRRRGGLHAPHPSHHDGAPHG